MNYHLCSAWASFWTIPETKALFHKIDTNWTIWAVFVEFIEFLMFNSGNIIADCVIITVDHNFAVNRFECTDFSKKKLGENGSLWVPIAFEKQSWCIHAVLARNWVILLFWRDNKNFPVELIWSPSHRALFDCGIIPIFGAQLSFEYTFLFIE